MIWLGVTDSPLWACDESAPNAQPHLTHANESGVQILELGPCRLRRQPRARLPSKDVGRRECQQPLLPTEVLLRVLSDHSGNGIPDDAFGFAVPPMLASVYYEHPAHLGKMEDNGVRLILAIRHQKPLCQSARVLSLLTVFWSLSTARLSGTRRCQVH